MKEHDFSKRHHRASSHDQSEMIAICLSDGPKTLSEIEKQFIEIPRRFGLFIELVDQESIDRGNLTVELKSSLDRMMHSGLLIEQNEKYLLTDEGSRIAAEKLKGIQDAGKLARQLIEPQTVSRITLGVHLGLAAIKFPAGLLSGSVGLINDAADTLLDGLASLLVYFGLRLNKERLVNILLVLLMLGTGIYTLFKAVNRILNPFIPNVDWFTFIAAGVSALVCSILWGYQRYAGLRSGSMALITQSVDSRNHIIVALGVSVGLIASLFQLQILDTIMGLAVAILIFKSAIELILESIRLYQSGDTDLSRFKIGLLDRYDRFKKEQFCNWMLYLIESQEVHTLSDLKMRVKAASDFSQNPALKGFGLEQPVMDETLVEACIQELYDKSWVGGKALLSVTESGREQLKRSIRKNRGERHRLQSNQ